LKNEIYEECLNHIGKGSAFPFWKMLADKFGYPSKEAIRSSFNNERKRRGNSNIPIDRLRKDAPKILIFDVETTPILGYVWSLWQDNMPIPAVVRDWHLLSYSGKWLFEDEVVSSVLTPKEIKNEDDKRISQEIWKLLDEADIAVAYNGVRFDVKRCNTRFLKHGFPPPSYFITVDPIITAKKRFSISSNKMDYVSEFLGGERKLSTNFDLWAKCMEGNSDALKEMESYNRQDVTILESLYLDFLPWDTSHPNLNVFYSDNITRCPKCGSENIHTTGKTYPTLTNQYPLYRCDDCKGESRGRKGLLEKEKSKTVIR
jgi:hypothetical protein